jgi:hypothetical protein
MARNAGTVESEESTATYALIGVLCLSFTLMGPISAAEPGPDATILARGAKRGAPVTPLHYDGDVRDLPSPEPWRPGDPIRAVPQRFYSRPGEQRPPVPSTATIDPLLDRQVRESSRWALDSALFLQTLRNFDGQGFTGAFPPDTVGDVGTSHYIQAVNGLQQLPFSRSARVRIYDKAQPVPNELANFKMEDLSGGACAGLADPIVLHDRQADRWLLAEMSDSANSLCVYLSQTGDPVSGGWLAYEFVMPGLPDYPKFGVWATDANGGDGSYVVVTNEGDPSGIYALERGQMLVGAAASSQRFTVPRLASFGFPTPADPDGASPPPGGAPAILMRQRDTELNDGPPSPGDVLEMWLLDIDWASPGNSTLAAAPSIDVAEFNSDLCDIVSACFEQPGSIHPLPPLSRFLMHRLQYMNHGTYESLIGNFTVDVNGLDRGGIRWFELRSVGGGPWALYQEGTYSTDADNRWVGTIAGDKVGNIALGFNVVSAVTFPDLRFTGRRSFDSPGVMTWPETVLAPGTDSEDSERYGDYAAMSLDPADDCTLWLTGEYSIVNRWQTRIASFRFENCPCVPPSASAVQADVSEDNHIDLSWNDSDSASVVEYLVQRSRTAGGPYTTLAVVPDSSPGVGGGAGYTYPDTDVSGGITYYYVVTALDGTSCSARSPVEASATATGACTVRPAFGGVQSASSGAATCSIDLIWSAAVASCGGPVTYDVYRSTTPGFAPSASNLLATGLLGTAATDANSLAEGVDYYYVVRAVDRANGLDDGNLIYRATTATGITPGGTQSFLDEDFESPDVLGSDWTVGTGPGPHSCGEWQRVDDAAYLPSGASGFYALALSQGCPATSTFLDSPVIDMSSPEIETVTLLAKLRFNVLDEQATVEAWNGSAWEVVLPPYSSVNGLFFTDVTAQAAGNSQFQVRFNYQNAANDDFYSVDDVGVSAELVLGSECSTSSGVQPVPDGSLATTPLTAARLDTAGTQIDIVFDATSCPAPGHNLLYGALSNVATGALDGSACGIGSGSYTWSAVPAGDLFFLVVGFDGNDVESRWGDSAFGERNGLTASGECGASLKNVALTCP